ncbi:MAG: hypothetical protein OEY52_02835 [Gammaproteobacteria bacterium]|nr:hypothetical protein [Gammaproteobacteria bacterium]
MEIVKSKQTDFGEFIFLDEHVVVAEAKSKVNIDASKVKEAIELIENEFNDSYAIILSRKREYSVQPVEVYKYFASLPRLKALAIVLFRQLDILPDNMEQRLYNGPVQKFESIESAHAWLKTFF